MDRVHTQPARILRRGIALTVLTLTLGLAACGAPAGAPAEPDAPRSPTHSPTPQESSAMPSTPSPADPSAPGAQASTLLTVEIRQSDTAEPVRYVLECSSATPGPNTTLPNAEEACATVASLGASFFNALPDRNVACTQQYGGPQTASITGTVDGTQILASFALTDGCEISRWNAVRSILGTGGAT
ncbi:SSI family serine proteinase inhibitor [Arthrobacter sp. Br18]|uniref:SSI family serine proteinase inhibitor n=1 Tax=Arthrobacter sp. Br18 TaxID=1312954 RepID=UPI000687C172|nr:SSI family serine proteinase inhibitor [Arthrobacter sp. Br18]